MIEGGIYNWVVPLGRTIAGFVVGAFLAIMGGWFAQIFNQLTAFAWGLEVHRTIYFLGIGVGAGVGAYCGWINLSIRRRLVAGSIILVLAGGIAGTYIGFAYGHIMDPTYMGQRATLVNSIHWGAAIGAILVSTVLGLIGEFRTLGR